MCKCMYISAFCLLPAGVTLCSVAEANASTHTLLLPPSGLRFSSEKKYPTGCVQVNKHLNNVI